MLKFLKCVGASLKACFCKSICEKPDPPVTIFTAGDITIEQMEN